MDQTETGRDVLRPAPEPEVLMARRAWPKAQELLVGVALRTVGRIAVGWHYTDTHPETGAFCVARRNGPYDLGGADPLLGDVLIVTRGITPIYVYCVNSAGIQADLSLTRRAFLALGRLSRDRLTVEVEVRA